MSSPAVVASPGDRESILQRIRRLPPWVESLVIYGASRLFSTALLGAMFVVATTQGWEFASYRADPTFFTFSGSWDASFYKRIAEDGYPTTLPLDDAGGVLPNPWAFLPVFPYLVKSVMMLTSLPFYPVAVVLAALFGAGASIALNALVRAVATVQQARWATLFFCFGPLAFLLQVAYAESLYLLLVFASLYLLVKRHYVLFIPIAVAASYTRPGALALALALGVHLVIRWFSKEPFPWRDRLAIIAGGIIVSAAGLSWTLIATLVTGHPDAYLETELSWWDNLVGEQSFAPFTPWFTLAGRYLGIAGIVLVVLLVGGFALWLSRKSVRSLGADLQAFAGSYALYLFAVFLPQQSTFRILLPLSPLLAAPTFTATAKRRWIVLVAGLVLQPVVIVLLWYRDFP